MKAPSKNISASLKGQRAGGRGPEPVNVSGTKSGVSMTVPGDGSVAEPPGAMHENSAAHFAAPCDRVK